MLFNISVYQGTQSAFHLKNECVRTLTQMVTHPGLEPGTC
nr:MAG TPA: hypothetical protein [Caudoviricetes sp.]